MTQSLEDLWKQESKKKIKISSLELLLRMKLDPFTKQKSKKALHNPQENEEVIFREEETIP